MKEIRNIEQSFEFNNESRLVTGYAIVFDSLSRDLGGFKEIIDKEALDGVLENSDILCLLNHNEDKGVLARSKYGKGSLTLVIDERGLKYSFEAPNTSLGNELLEGIKRGDITTSSFAFTIDKDEWTKNEDGSYIRTIKKFRELFDVSPVYQEAYSDTSVALRKMQNLEEKEDLTNYFEELKNKIK